MRVPRAVRPRRRLPGRAHPRHGARAGAGGAERLRRRPRGDARQGVGHRSRRDRGRLPARKLLLRRPGVGVVLPGGDVAADDAVERRQGGGVLRRRRPRAMGRRRDSCVITRTIRRRGRIRRDSRLRAKRPRPDELVARAGTHADVGAVLLLRQEGRGERGQGGVDHRPVAVPGVVRLIF